MQKLQLAAVRSENAVSAVELPTSGRLTGVPGEWLHGFDRLVSMPVPLGLEVTRWLEVRADTERFLVQWGARAAALGWDTLNLFGVGRDAPEEQIHLAGLAWLLKGKTVAAMTEQLAMVDMGRGVKQSFPRRDRPGQIPIWCLPLPQKRKRQEVSNHD
ncbi:hypothetical protein [Pelagibius sp. Alg239-R121]|uniref:hypothetical protein n=1 Tax=Pelagibius sp. Alg239-R121 TaxID=2993448 RepID=UPI0024A6A1C8|nr:hypothetical protein [Pelagibius sp. Alg239-R121]